MNSESGREARQMNSESGPEALDLLQRWKQKNSESGPEARAPEARAPEPAPEPATPANSGQARRGRPRPEGDQLPPQRETQETGQFPLLAPKRVVCVRACGHTHR